MVPQHSAHIDIFHIHVYAHGHIYTHLYTHFYFRFRFHLSASLECCSVRFTHYHEGHLDGLDPYTILSLLLSLIGIHTNMIMLCRILSSVFLKIIFKCPFESRCSHSNGSALNWLSLISTIPNGRREAVCGKYFFFTFDSFVTCLKGLCQETGHVLGGKNVRVALRQHMMKVENHYPPEWCYLGVSFLCKHFGTYH